MILLIENTSSKRYEPPFIDLTNKNCSHTLIIDLAGQNKKILEIGTSTGFVTKILQERQNEIVGIEIDPDAAHIAEKYCSRMIIGDIEKCDLDNFFTGPSFDVIILGDVLEHLIYPKALLRNVKKILKEDGYLIVSLPNFCHGDVILTILQGDFHYTDMGLLDKTHLRFFGLKNIYSLFSEAGYQISNLTSTYREIGETELPVRMDKIPDQLRWFIRLLPETRTYQYIFTAFPSDNPRIPPDDERILDREFTGLFEGRSEEFSERIIKKREEEIKKQYRNLEAIVADRNQQIRLLKKENDALKTSFLKKGLIKIHRMVIERFFPPVI
jgi:O-antigen biosynthesis protein